MAHSATCDTTEPTQLNACELKCIVSSLVAAGDQNGKEEAVLSDFGLHTLLSKSGAHSPSPDTTM